MSPSVRKNISETSTKKLKEIAVSSLKLGTIGFGGIAGMVATIENEMIIHRKWIDHQHFIDALSTSYIIPGPSAQQAFPLGAPMNHRFQIVLNQTGNARLLLHGIHLHLIQQVLLYGDI
jgi:hypothetical protein